MGRTVTAALTALAIVVVVVAVAARWANEPSEPRGRVDGPLLSSVGGIEHGMTALVHGRLTYRHGCLLLHGHPVIWPEGTTWDSEQQTLRLRSGDEVELGASVSGGGGALSLENVEHMLGEAVAQSAARCLETIGGTGVTMFNADSDLALD